MWSALQTRRSVLLSGGRAYLRQASAPWSFIAIDLGACAFEELGSVLSSLAKPRLTPSLDVIVGSGLCRFAALDRPKGIRNETDASSVLQAYALKKMGLKEADWRFVIDNRRRRQILGCAIRKATLEKISGWCESSGHGIRGIRPLAVLQPKRASAAVEHPSKNGSISGWALLEEDAVSAIDCYAGIVRIASSNTNLDESRFAMERLQLSVGEGRPARTFALKQVSDSAQLWLDFADLLVENPS